MSSASDRIIVPLDVDSPDEALRIVESLRGRVGLFKVGLQLFCAAGPGIVRALVDRGERVFLDLKFHDIPNTVARACEAAAALGVWMVNVHAAGGSKMMRAAREALDAVQDRRPLLIAVTVLTSMDKADLAELGIAAEPEQQVMRLAALARGAGLDGVVCSPREAAPLRGQIGDDFLLVTPGVRPQGAALDDQARVLTPAEAIRQGSSYLVMGRPITRAEDPVAALEAVNRELQAAE